MEQEITYKGFTIGVITRPEKVSQNWDVEVDVRIAGETVRKKCYSKEFTNAAEAVDDGFEYAKKVIDGEDLTG